MRLVEIGPGRLAHALGALWLPAAATALVADVHLGYGWAMRRRGQLGPVADGGAAARLEELLEELAPRRLVVLGDLVHAPRPAREERRMIEETVTRVADRVAELVLVRGNHDRGFVSDFPELPLRTVNWWTEGGLVAAHGDRMDFAVPEGGHVVLGHVHPALRVIDDAGASRRVPVFVAGDGATLLPAFSPFSAGADVRRQVPREIGKMLGSGALLYAATGRRVVPAGLWRGGK